MASLRETLESSMSSLASPGVDGVGCYCWFEARLGGTWMNRYIIIYFGFGFGFQASTWVF
jgi:hypothetical protein